MKLEINTVTKTLTILSKVDLNELLSFIKENGMESWAIEPKEEPVYLCKEFYKRGPSYIPPYIPSSPSVKDNPYSPPYIVTCSTNNYEVNTD